MNLQGNVAVVTGAASGIGAATARVLSARGARLVLVDVNEAALRTIGEELGAAYRTVNVANSDEVEALAEWVSRTLGGASLLVNNAGVTVVGTFAEHQPADWDRVMGVNFYGVLNGCRSFLPQLRAQPRGWIVNISSVFGLFGVPGQTAYCASKYAVRGLSESLYEELRGSSVGLTVVHPGGVRTRIVADATVAGGAPNEDGMDRLRGFFEKQAMAPERVAERIVGAVEAETHRLLVCPETTAIDLLRRIHPELGNRVAVAVLSRALGLGALRARLKV